MLGQAVGVAWYPFIPLRVPAFVVDFNLVFIFVQLDTDPGQPLFDRVAHVDFVVDGEVAPVYNVSFTGPLPVCTEKIEEGKT